MVNARDRAIARDQAINIRVSAEQRHLIDQAARSQHLSRSEFMLGAAFREAENVMLDRVYFRLEPGAFEAFERMLDAPVEPSPALRKLFSRPTPWEE